MDRSWRCSYKGGYVLWVARSWLSAYKDGFVLWVARSWRSFYKGGYVLWVGRSWRSSYFKGFSFLVGIFVLIAFWLAGSALVEWLNWPIPGSVVGLLFLWVALVINGGVPAWLKQPSGLLIRYLTLLFVPAGVGLIQHWQRLKDFGLEMVIIIAVSTLLAALAMVVIFKVGKAKS